MVTHTRRGKPVGEGGGDVCSLGGDKKSCSWADARSFRALTGKMLEFGGAKLLKLGELSGGRRIRPIFVFGDAFFSWRMGRRLANGGWWLVDVAQHANRRITPSESLRRGWCGQGDEEEGRKRALAR
jgi:hypothetical protein